MSGLKIDGWSVRRAAGAVCAVALALVLLSPTASRAADAVRVPSGIWLMPLKVAVRVFDCSGRLCGQLVWVQKPRDSEGQLLRDPKNPDPTLRWRPACGQTVMWGLQPAGPGRWKNGWLYNADDGKTYRVKAELRSDDMMVARIYYGLPLFGETWTMSRVERLSSEGWC